MKISPERQEKVFKYLWKEMVVCKRKEGTFLICTCGWEPRGDVPPVISEGYLDDHIQRHNPDLTSPQGMSMILKRLVEMGYDIDLDYTNGTFRFWLFHDDIHTDEGDMGIEAYGDTPELAVFEAVFKLAEGEL